MSSERETLDQLLTGDMPLTVVRQFYPDDAAFIRGVLGLLNEGDVRIFAQSRLEVPKWQWRELFAEGAVLKKLDLFRLDITEQGTKKIS